MAQGRKEPKLFAAIRLGDLNLFRKSLAKNKKQELGQLWDGQTLLHIGIEKFRQDIFKELIAAYASTDANPNLPDGTGDTPLHCAAQYGTEEALVPILKLPQINVTLRNEDGNTPLHYFCQHYKDPNAEEPFRIFLEKWPENLREKNSHGETPLHKAMLNPQLLLFMVNILLGAGADVNARNDRGESVLHFAVRVGRADVVKRLCQAGADITARGAEKLTPLELADRQGSSLTKYLSDVTSLHEWLDEEGLLEIETTLVKQEVFIDVLPLIDDQLLQQIGVKSVGTRLRAIKAIEKLREKERSSSMSGSEADQADPEVEAPTSSATPPAPSVLTQSVDLSTHSELSSSLPERDEEEESEASKPAEEKRGETEEWIRNVLGTTEDEMWIPPTDLIFDESIGSGQASKVYSGQWHGAAVAIKVLKAKPEVLIEFQKEFNIMKALSSPYTVKLFGVSRLRDKAALVMELCSRGTLYDLLKGPQDCSWSFALRIAVSAAAGLAFLHGHKPPIFHRDFKSLNLLVSEEGICKLADFGLSRRDTADNLQTLTEIRGTAHYIAPELLGNASGQTAMYNSKSDVYSLGIVYWEIFTRVMVGEYRRPFQDRPELSSSLQVMFAVSSGARPTLPDSTPDPLKKIYLRCVDRVNTARPSCARIMKDLEDAHRAYSRAKAQWNSVRTGTGLAPLKDIGAVLRCFLIFLASDLMKNYYAREIQRQRLPEKNQQQPALTFPPEKQLRPQRAPSTDSPKPSLSRKMSKAERPRSVHERTLDDSANSQEESQPRRERLASHSTPTPSSPKVKLDKQHSESAKELRRSLKAMPSSGQATKKPKQPQPDASFDPFGDDNWTMPTKKAKRRSLDLTEKRTSRRESTKTKGTRKRSKSVDRNKKVTASPKNSGSESKLSSSGSKSEKQQISSSS